MKIAQRKSALTWNLASEASHNVVKRKNEELKEIRNMSF
jgi:hypothetical protein